MKIVYILLHLLYLVTSECSYIKAGVQYYCEECCYWYDGDWYCESYGFCYTSVSIIIAAWTMICLAYLTLFFHSKKKTEQRIVRIHDLSIQAQREMVKEKQQTNQEQPPTHQTQSEVFIKAVYESECYQHTSIVSQIIEPQNEQEEEYGKEIIIGKDDYNLKL